MTNILKDKISFIILNMKEVTKDRLLWAKQRVESIIPNREEAASRSDEEILMDRYYDALRQLEVAEQNFELAEQGYIEVAILELQTKKLMLNTILKELKTKRIIE